MPTQPATSDDVLHPGHNHLLTTGTGAWATIKVSGHQYRWLPGSCDLGTGHFRNALAWFLPGG